MIYCCNVETLRFVLIVSVTHDVDAGIVNGKHEVAEAKRSRKDANESDPLSSCRGEVRLLVEGRVEREHNRKPGCQGKRKEKKIHNDIAKRLFLECFGVNHIESSRKAFDLFNNYKLRIILYRIL